MKSVFLTLALAALPALAQHEGHDMSQMQMQQADPAYELLMRQGSGTSLAPAAVPMSMGAMTQAGGWMLMAHGNAFVSAVMQSGPRGDDAIFSTNWAMGMASRKLAGGQLLLRTMLSLEPRTMPRRGYPMLFQTGETYGGRPLVDAQHPHNAFMELAAEYAHVLPGGAVGYVYAAPVGDPALGPVAFPHRVSALELPQATLAHHLEDSTHIATAVLTLGAKQGAFGLEVSGFHGAEPGENRWKIAHGGLDSWSVRGTWEASKNWSAQLSTGHLTDPEALEEGDTQRTTASVTHLLPLPAGSLASSVIWGHNAKDHGDTNGLTAESTWRFGNVNYLVGRLEVVEKDELQLDDATHTVTSLTLGYTRDVFRTAGLLGGVGGNVTLYAIPRALQPAYGAHPRGGYVFVRLRAE
jgi:hypothetical protein